MAGYQNLKAEMKRRNIHTYEIAEAINKSEVGVSKNLNNAGGDFKLHEALVIQKVFFPDCDFRYLFTKY